MKPLRLGPNQLQRFYRGGERIARFRGLPPTADDRPEDWVGATTTVSGSETVGLARLADGRFLRDAVAAEPEAFVGAEHASRFGPDPLLLVKLLDAGERLPVHAHPDDAFARDRLGAPRGKTEAWLVVAVEGERPSVHVGFREDVEAATVLDWVDRQDAEAMLAALNERPVAAGDCIYVPAGTPHAIGEGVFMVEVQQPADVGVLLEFRRFGLEEAEAHLGLGFEAALESVRLTAVGSDELDGWMVRRDTGSLIPPEAERFFRAARVGGDTQLEAAYSILAVVSGAGRIESDDGPLELGRGDTVLVPYAAGACRLEGDLDAIRCLPPDPFRIPLSKGKKSGREPNFG